MKMFQDNKHYQAAKIDGFWDFVTRDPGDYVGKRRLDPKKDRHQLWMGCPMCRDSLKAPA